MRAAHRRDGRLGTASASAARRSAHAAGAACGALPARRSARVRDRGATRLRPAVRAPRAAAPRAVRSRAVRTPRVGTPPSVCHATGRARRRRARTACRRIVLDQPAGVAHGRLEPDDVDRVGVDLQHVSVVARLQHVALAAAVALRFEGRSQSARSRPTGRSPYRLRRRPTAPRGSGRSSPRDWRGAASRHSSARCLRGPRSTGWPSSTTSIGPSSRNSTPRPPISERAPHHGSR